MLERISLPQTTIFANFVVVCFPEFMTFNLKIHRDGAVTSTVSVYKVSEDYKGLASKGSWADKVIDGFDNGESERSRNSTYRGLHYS